MKINGVHIVDVASIQTDRGEDGLFVANYGISDEGVVYRLDGTPEAIILTRLVEKLDRDDVPEWLRKTK